MKAMMHKLCCMKHTHLGILALRLAVGVPFLLHGFQKLSNLEQTTGFFSSLGVPGFLATLVGVVELVGGLALILGVGTMLAGYALAAIMLAAIILVKGKMGILGGHELEFVLLLAALAVANLGCGSYSMCAKMCKRKMGMMKDGCCGSMKEACCDMEHGDASKM